MEDLAARLCDLLPEVPLRQWTVSFPFALRRLLAADGDLLSAIHRSFVRIVFETLRASAPVPGRNAAISFLQRFDSSLGLDPHVHLACVDGVYAERSDGTLEFHDAGTPSSADVETVAVLLHRSIRRLFLRRGLITKEGELAPRDSQVMTPLERLYEAAARDFIPSGTLDDNGKPLVRRPVSRPAHLGPRLVDVDGVNVHADLRIEAGDHQGRYRLLRYALRPPFAYDQITLTPDGRIAFALRKPRRNGDTHRFFTPTQFLRRLAWLVAPPRQHLIRYQGLLGPASPWRARLVPSPPKDSPPPLGPRSSPPDSPSPPPSPPKRRPLTWPELLKRVYHFDVLACPKPGCGGRMRVIAAITQEPVVRRILDHLGLPTDVPRFTPARAPPEAELDFSD
jgi:hypothetical protein